GARGGGFARAHFAGEQTRAVMICQELEPCPHLVPGLAGEQLFGVGTVGKGRFLEAEIRFPHGLLVLLFPRRQAPVDDRIHQARHAFRFPFAVNFQLGRIERIEAHLDAFAGQMRGASKKRLCSRKVESRRTRRSTRWKNTRRRSVEGASWRTCSISRCQRSSGVVCKELCSWP